MIASGLIYALNNEGYEVIHCQDVQSALEQIKAYMNPGMDDIMVDYASDRTYEVNELTGRSEAIMERTIQSQ